LDEERTAHHFPPFSKQASISFEDRLLVDRPVVGAKVDVAFSRLHPSTGHAASIGLGEKRRPVLYGAEKVANMDQVKSAVVPGPVEGGVVDLEADIGGKPVGLAGREVCADYGGVGEAVGEFAGENVSFQDVEEAFLMGRMRREGGEVSAYIAHMPVMGDD
jgi:hypothetical protein